MKRNELVIAALMGIFAVPARAQPLTGPAMSALSQLADNQKNPEDTFDGMPILRREPPLVILEEKKGVLIKEGRTSGHYTGHYRDKDDIRRDCDSMNHSSIECSYDMGRDFKVYGTHQKVGIEDRTRFVKEAQESGAINGLVGGGTAGIILGLALTGGLLAALPVAAGVFIGFGVVWAGAMLGNSIAKYNAKQTPRIFERDIETRRVRG